MNSSFSVNYTEPHNYLLCAWDEILKDYETSHRAYILHRRKWRDDAAIIPERKEVKPMEKRNQKINSVHVKDERKGNPYEPPNATFVPTTIEERMMYCGKGAGNVGGGCFFGCK